MSDLWSFKLEIALATALISVSSLMYSISINDIYKSEMLVERVSDGAESIPTQFGTLAAITGVSLPGSFSKDKSTYALEILKTRDFFEKLIQDESFLIELAAVNDFNKNTTQLSYDKDFYNKETKKLNPNFYSNTSFLKLHNLFLNSITIKEEETGSLRISVEHISPIISKEWLDLIFQKLNETVKKIKTKEAEESLNYLNNQLALATESELKKVIADLIEKQIQTLMISDISNDFVFSIIDSPRIPEKKYSPHRSRIVILTTLLGFLLSCSIRLIYFSVYINPKIK